MTPVELGQWFLSVSSSSGVSFSPPLVFLPPPSVAPSLPPFLSFVVAPGTTIAAMPTCLSTPVTVERCCLRRKVKSRPQTGQTEPSLKPSFRLRSEKTIWITTMKCWQPFDKCWMQHRYWGTCDCMGSKFRLTEVNNFWNGFAQMQRLLLEFLLLSLEIFGGECGDFIWLSQKRYII